MKSPNQTKLQEVTPALPHEQGEPMMNRNERMRKLREETRALSASGVMSEAREAWQVARTWAIDGNVWESQASLTALLTPRKTAIEGAWEQQ